MTKPPHDRLVNAVFSEPRQAVLLLDTFLPELRFLLADLSGVTDDQIKAQVLLRAKTVFAGLTVPLTPRIFARHEDPEPPRREPVALGRVEATSRPNGLPASNYRLRTSNSRRRPPDPTSERGHVWCGTAAMCARARASQEAEDTIMNLAEKLRAEGRQEGRQEGQREGRRKGREEGLKQGLRKGLEAGARESLLRLLRLRFGQVDSAALARIQAADLPMLECWLDRVLSAPTLGDVPE